jgi:4a-hydroxytetrahydrobiopterin dehydratase
MAPAKLSDIEIQRELGTLAGWARRGDVLSKTFSFDTFPEGITFVDQLAKHAESVQHHPDIDIRYTKISIGLSTHDSGGISGLDIEMARYIEKLVG